MVDQKTDGPNPSSQQKSGKKSSSFYILFVRNKMEVTKQIMMCDKCFDKKSVFDLSKVSDRKCAVCDTNYCSDKIHRGQEYSSTEHLPREYPFPFVCKDCRDMALNGKYESRIPRLSNKSLNGSCSSFSIQL